jgi:hypothetical protein
MRRQSIIALTVLALLAWRPLASEVQAADPGSDMPKPAPQAASKAKSKPKAKTPKKKAPKSKRAKRVKPKKKAQKAVSGAHAADPSQAKNDQ